MHSKEVSEQEVEATAAAPKKEKAPKKAETPADTPLEFTPKPTSCLMVAQDNDGNTVLTIAADGTLAFGAMVQPKEAAKVFAEWVNEVTEQVRTVDREPRDDLLKQAHKFLREIAEHLNTGAKGLGPVKYGTTKADMGTFMNLREWANNLYSELNNEMYPPKKMNDGQG
jgi:hypothetical protein